MNVSYLRIYLIKKAENLLHDILESISSQNTDKFENMTFTMRLIKDKDVVTILSCNYYRNQVFDYKDKII